MFRVVENNHPASAKRYYTGGLARGDYFTGEPEELGIWGGKGAARLGLTGPVDRLSFVRLCDNTVPDGSGSLTERTKANRRVGYDLNFHCPKSVSVLHALTGDPALLAAFRDAVNDTMALVEAEAKTRVRLGGVSQDRPTANLVWGTFIHTTSRPIDGLPDPHLHAHCFTFNATYDEVEGRWKAGQFGDIKRNAPYLEACFHASLAARVAQAGYAVEQRGKFWEIAGVPDSVIEKFSRRTAEIERTARERGITDARAKDRLGARTRKSKSESKPRAFIEEHWRARLSPAEERELLAAKRDGHVAREVSPREAVEQALSLALERSTIAEERRVIEGALRYGLGSVTAEDAKRELARLGVIRREVQGRVLVTTPGVIEQEGRMLAFSREGRGACPPLHAKASIEGTTLTERQKVSVLRLLQCPDRVILFRPGVRGAAAIEAAVAGIESGGHQVQRLDARVVTSPRAKESSLSVAQFLRDGSARAAAKGAVIWVKNAERLGVTQLCKLFDAVKQLNARVVLSGQPYRKGPPEQRGALALLEDQGGVSSPETQDRLERRGEMRAAVQAMQGGRMKEAFSGLDRLGQVYESRGDGLLGAVAKEYAKAVRERKSARIACPFHSYDVTAAVRRELREQRLLGRSRTLDRLTRVGLSERQRKDASFYERGQVVIFYKSAKGFRAGHRYQVIARDPFGNVLAREVAYDRPLPLSKKLWVEALPLSKSDRFDVFRRSTIELAKGDLVRVTATGRTKNEHFGPEKLLSKRHQAIRLANYELLGKLFGVKAPDRRYRVPKDSVHRIAGFTLKGDIKLENGWVLPKRFGHLDYGYSCVGATGSFDRLIVVDDPKQRGSFGVMDAPKGVETVVVFTDDKRKLFEAVSGRESAPRRSAQAAREQDGMKRYERGSRDSQQRER